MSTTTTTATTATATTSATTTATTCRPPAKKLKLKLELGSSPDANLKLCWRTLNASAICSSRAFPAMRTTRQTRRRRADRFPYLHPNLKLLPDTVAAPPADHLLPLRGLQKCPPTLGAASPVSQSDRIVVPSKTLPVLGTVRNSTEVASTFAAADARCRRQFLPELLLRPGLFFLQKIS